MTDRLDRRIQSFVVELLADPPPAPPFPHPDTVVIDGGRRMRREPMTATTDRRKAPSRQRSRGPLVGALAFAAILLVAIVTVVLVNARGSDDGPVAGPGDFGRLAGTSWQFETASPSEAGTLRFETGNRFSVTIPNGAIIDSGTYRTEGDVITFITESPYDCAGTEGAYRMMFATAGRARLAVVLDDCIERIADATKSDVLQVTD